MKRIKTEREIALVNEKENIKTYIEERSDELRELARKARSMEGKYATSIIYDEYGDMHYRNYTYTYPTFEVRLKEHEEIKKFEDDNGLTDWYKGEFTYFEKEYARIKEIDNELSIIRYGKTTEQKEIERTIKHYKAELEELNERKAYLENYIAENS